MIDTTQCWAQVCDATTTHFWDFYLKTSKSCVLYSYSTGNLIVITSLKRQFKNEILFYIILFKSQGWRPTIIELFALLRYFFYNEIQMIYEIKNY